jgi:Zn ribbon nucleic-acid-binding protein
MQRFLSGAQCPGMNQGRAPLIHAGASCPGGETLDYSAFPYVNKEKFACVNRTISAAQCTPQCAANT